jgi:hypothetical protein
VAKTVIDAEGLAAAFSARLWEAHKAHEGRTGVRLSQSALGELVGKRIGRDVGMSTAATWFKGTVPGPATVLALSQIYEVSPGWLLFGEGTMKGGYYDPPKAMPLGGRIELATGSRKAR